MHKLLSLTLLIVTGFSLPTVALAHQSGCHRWHSCPSDSGSYVCGDLGYPCKYGTYKNVTPKAKTYNTPNYVTQGSVVYEDQSQLAKLGYLTSSQVDGYFGLVTDRAVKKFQLDNGLTVDGIIGKVTRARMYSN